MQMLDTLCFQDLYFVKVCRLSPLLCCSVAGYYSVLQCVTEPAQELNPKLLMEYWEQDPPLSTKTMSNCLRSLAA